MFLKQDRPEMDDFERKKNFGCYGKYLEKFQYFKKILGKMFKFLTDTLAKSS